MSRPDDTDPSGWSDERLERHAREWMGLPLTACEPVMSDDDAEAHGDLLYLRALLDDLTHAKAELQKEVRSPDGRYTPAVMWLGWLCHSARAWEPLVLRFDTSWRTALAPMEAVGRELAVWREELNGKAAA